MQIKEGYFPGRPAQSEKKPKLGKKERQIVLFLIAAVLVITALALWSATTVQRAGGGGGGGGQLASSCSGYLYTQDYYNCIYRVANATHNSSVCNNLPADGRANCLYGLAANSRNISVCMQINQSTQEYAFCVGRLLNLTMNMSYCDSLGFPQGSQCIYNLSARENFANLTVCSKLKNASYAAACRDLYYFKRADATGTAAYCSNLEKNASPVSLYTMFLTINESNINSTQYGAQLITYAALNFTPYSYCNYRLAVDFKEQGLCGNISNNLTRTACTSTFKTYNAIPANALEINYSAANTIGACVNTNYKSLCSFVYAVNRSTGTNNDSACLELNQSSGRDSCLYTLALTFANPSYCASIVNSSFKGLCLNQSAASSANFTAPNVTFSTTVP